MKVLFLGLGSIGQRHLRLLKTLTAKQSFEFFALRSGAGETPTPEGVTLVRDWQEIEKVRPAIAFVCNPTSLHIPAALECARRGMHLFLEKPIAHDTTDLSELRTLVREKSLTAYVAYPLRFHPAVVALRKRLSSAAATPGHVRCVVSSYLPDWRPGTDHLKSYSAQRQMGGGVILDLSHEFDLIEYLFGTISTPSGSCARLGNVTVDAEDCADAVFKAGPHLVNLHMNFMSLHAERSLVLDTPGHYARLDLLAGKLHSRQGSTQAELSTESFLHERDDMYVTQLKYFLDNLGNTAIMNNLETATTLFEKIIAFRTASWMGHDKT